MDRLPLAPAFLGLGLLASALATGLSACDVGGGSASTGDSAVVATGCALPAGSSPKSAPGGYYVNGNTVCTAAGKPHLFHGVDRPSLEWDPAGKNLSAQDFALMASWHANVVRVALNQDFWLADAPSHDAGYPARIDQVVAWAEEAGLDVILDLHWSDRGDYAVMPGQQTMADQHSIAFWKEVAARYKGDGRVIFELYNEPHDVTADVWLSGGQAGFAVAGMQQLHDAVRSAGADNLVIAGGLNWAFDLGHVGSSPVVGYNVLYATHPYNNAADRQPAQWYAHWGYLAKTAPIIVTEFGDGTGSCSPDWDKELIAYADDRHASWTAWAWWAGDCKFPSLLQDWSATPTNEGAAVKAALLGYDDPAPGGMRVSDAGDGDAGDAGSHE